MIYLVEEKHRYHFNYKEIKEKYEAHVRMSDSQFIHALPTALHLACIICWFKNIPTDIVLGDLGLIHELVHLLEMGDEGKHDIKRIRKLFKKQLKLS